MLYEIIPARYNLHPEEMPMKVIYTEEELDDINDIESSIRSYVSESITRFAMGDIDIEKDWDAYLAELENIGLTHYIEVVQQAYDRLNGK